MSIQIGIGDGHRRIKFTFMKRLFFAVGWALGARWLDTAQQYGSGESEKSLRLANPGFKVITKIGLWKCQSAEDPGRWDRHYGTPFFSNLVVESFHRIGRSYLDCVLLHCPNNQASHSNRISELRRNSNAGSIGLLGFSADSAGQIPHDLTWADVAEMPMSLLQGIEVLPYKTIVINGIFREKINFDSLQSLIQRNEGVNFILLVGTGRILRLIVSILKLKRLIGRTSGKP